MSIFKCKMCGGTIEFEQGATVGVCEYCGTKQTLPRLDDDKKANLYDRANHFRRSNDFDKAMGIYETILNEDSTDAEAYWSLVLCRYGIEYVEDPATHKRIPTVNRAQYTSIFMDEDYKSAIKHADGYQREIYEQEAKAIDEIQKGILEISRKEEPFDCFISFKETDVSGKRTRDAVLAQDLYNELTKEGFKVFFAPVTLEDKLGTAYEPYIFAALNSAKVMVVLGTKPEHFNAVWVKNEWSRYLALIKGGAKKTLIPAYRDMDPYDLPDEFSHLMAQDMSKLGFMQDLIRGIKKLLADEPKPSAKETVVVNGGAASVAPLLKRAFMFLEDGSWQDAYNYCEKVLDQDPECGEAYWGQFLAAHRSRDVQDAVSSVLSEVNITGEAKDACEKAVDRCEKAISSTEGFLLEQHIIPLYDDIPRSYLETAPSAKAACSSVSASFAANKTLQKAKKFAGGETKKSIDEFSRLLDEGLAKIVSDASAEDERRKSEVAQQYYDALDAADTKVKEMCVNAKDSMYNAAISNMNAKSVSGYTRAIDKFEKLNGWKDSDKKLDECRRGRKLAEEAEQKKAAKAQKILSIAIVAIIAAVAIFFVVTKIVIPNSNYDTAVELMDSGKYEEAIAAFEAMGDYKDSVDKIDECNKGTDYNTAIKLMESGLYEYAITAFKELGDYKDCADKIDECNTAIFKAEMKVLQTASVGDTVRFGKYEQDKDMSNGKEDIEWLVLAKDSNKILVISKYALYLYSYGVSSTNATWDNCPLRNNLNGINGIFRNTAFSVKEQTALVQTNVTADKNPKYDTAPGNGTADKIFVLSIDEVNKYFSSDSARQCKLTASALTGEKEYCVWWLRTPGKSQSYAAYVDSSGEVQYGGKPNFQFAGVRPAMWINLDA